MHTYACMHGILSLQYIQYNIMKTILAIVVIFCFIAMGMAQNQDCTRRAGELNTCTSGEITSEEDYCNTCANNLIRYYQDCVQGVGVDEIQRRK